MKYLKIKRFERDLKDNGLGDEDMAIVLDDILKGRAVFLGSRLYKIRGAPSGRGKRSGFRSIFFWKKDEFIIFCLLFSKNEQDNLNFDERKALKILSERYEELTEVELIKNIENKQFMEIKYGKE